jgi:3-hydroxymyristoyl/3-hydroxydecanoyl-(acyl carrier protein) dehydratase
MLESSKTSAARTARIVLAVEHKAADGHFPGNPIIPGAVLLREVIAAIVGDAAQTCREMRSAKFHRPVRPGDSLVVSWTASAHGDIRFTCCLAGSGHLAVSGAFRLAPL